MRTLELPQGAPPREWGRIHGETFAAEIAELAEIRLGLILKNWSFDGEGEVDEVARQHLPVLREFDASLYEEMVGLSEGSGLSLERLVVLNHYTDLRDLRPLRAYQEDGCSSVYSRNGRGSFLGQTWDMHGSAAPYVMMMRIPEPECWVLTITGCLALSGLNCFRLGVTINNLLCTDAKVGVVWPALVRRMLRERTARGAYDVLMAAPIGSGHHYLTADPMEVFGVESSATLHKTLYRGDPPVYYHTNHCLDEEMKALSYISKTSTTLARYKLMNEGLAECPEPAMESLWELLNLEGIFTNLTTDEQPHAMFSCATLMMHLDSGRLWAREGLSGPGEPQVFALEELAVGG